MNRIVLLLLALVVLSNRAEAASQSIWGSTYRGPGTATMRFPVDISSSSSPGYLQPVDLPCAFNLGSSLTNTGTGCSLNTTQPGRSFAGTSDTITSADSGYIVTYSN